MVKQNIKANLPPLHNSRAEQHWQIVSQRVDFAGKTVVDLGCGYGDLSLRATANGSLICAVDSNIKPFKNRSDGNYNIALVKENLNDWELDQRFDIAFCFSVLPYLDKPDNLLSWMCKNAGISFIECQYHGDGPGLKEVKNDHDMRLWLSSVGWGTIEPIGRTHIVGRNMYRTVWMCQ